ncbi:Arylsulfatase [Pirellula sp. SH-Sr6A]|uniref:sulfatase family protein n=1 Tax=Pirellula sp. SH-Sr6A TaxID=1632865 RepID=UPI00078EA2B9|nr:arylsulfatase [Pirellula sp. SH-Sr6A]AMV34298.1 Arylsulfatase [Pirellula sp. SH-Sr6A]
MKRTVKLWLALIVFAAFSYNIAIATELQHPNIVLILADDLGYGDVQCLNPQRGKIQTPNLDRLATQGMVFTDAHSGSSVCTPTRYGLLTGRYAWRTRLQKGVLDGGNDEPLIAEDRFTLGAMLSGHGYVAACIGKWHLGFQSDARTVQGGKAMGQNGLPVGAKILGGPITRGFDTFWGCSNARTMSSLIEGDRVIEMIETVDMLPRLGQRAVQFIESHIASSSKESPFFLYLPLTSPHTPIVPSDRWRGKSGLGDYGDFVMQTDAIVADVLKALDEQGIADNTLVLFSSDNGCSPAADTEKLEAAGHFASERYRGYKADIWDGGHRVPLFVRWPGKVKPGTQSDQLICLTDVIATCAEIIGHKLPDTAGEDSVSFLPTLLGKETPVVRESIVHHSIQGKFAIRDKRWKLCLCNGSGGWSKGKTTSPQLYDMQTDPEESNNMAQHEPDVVARLSELLKRFIERGRSTPGTEQANDVKVNAPYGTLD